tara:strand:- start:11844 stop:15521 length:3678 start_codon:yes stop_codon:yes gene_type:complete
MIPYNSNKSGGCNNVSSNCVVWQGPDLPCIDLCHGDTISDVMAKFCEELVKLKQAPGVNHGTMEMARINQSGLENGSGQQAQPATNQTELTNLIIENVVQARQANQSDFGSGDVLTTPVTLPTSMQYTDPNTASVVRALPLQQYAELVGNRITETVSEVTTLQGQVGNHEGRIVQLENAEKKRKINPTEKQIVTTCVGNPGRLTNLSTALSEVERAFCGLQSSTGPQSDLAASIGYQGASMGSAKKLHGTGTLSTVTGFVNSPSTLAQSFTNAWIVINDMRQALETLQKDVIPSACSDITYGFFANATGDPGLSTSININFTQTTVPSSFYDCDKSNGSKITVTDTYGASAVFNRQIHQLQNTNEGTALSITNLDGSSATFDVTVEYCFTNGAGVQCANTTTKTITNVDICPTMSLTAGTTTISFTVDASKLPSKYSARITLMNSKGSTLASQVRDNPSNRGPWTGSFTGLTQGQQYQVQVSYGLTQGGNFEHSCNKELITTTGTTCADSTILAAVFKTTPTDLAYSTAGSFIAMACDDVRNPGTNMGDIYIAGFTTADGEVAGVLKNNTIWAETLTPCAAGKITSTGVSLDYNNPVKSLVTNGVTTARTDTTTNTLGDGWRYMDGITSTNGKNYYVYAEVNTDASAAPIIPQTYFSCLGDEVNISQAAWTNWVPYADLQYAFNTSYNYQIAHGNTVQASDLIYDIGAASFGTNSFTPNPIPSNTQQFAYAPIQAGSFKTTDSNTTKLTIGSKNSGDYTSSFSRGFWATHLTTDLVVFIDTDKYTSAEGAAIKTSMTAVHTEITNRYSGYTGKLYILPLKAGGFDGTKQKVGSEAAYLSHHRIIALRGDGVALNTTGDWNTIKQVYTSSTTPTGWWGNTANSLSTNFMLFSFVQQSYRSIVEGSEEAVSLYTTTNASAAPSAPTARFKDDYDDVMNILVDNNRNTTGDAGTFKGPSTWAASETVALNSEYPILTNAIYRCDGHYVIPKQTGLHAGADASDKALIRQMILACNATANGTTAALTANEYNAYRFGSDYFNVEGISNWKANLDTNANPYNATVTTSNSNALAPLVNLNITIVPYMDGYFEIPVTGANLNDPYTAELKKLLCLDSVVGASAIPTAGAYSQMGGAGAQYGTAPIGTNTVAGACGEAAKGGGSCINMYNKTGTQFDPTCKVYTTTAGATGKDYRVELIHNRYYARCDGSAGKAVAQYSRTYPHWKNETVCS